MKGTVFSVNEFFYDTSFDEYNYVPCTNIEVTTINVEAQVRDLRAMHGLDLVQAIEQELVEHLNTEINREILNDILALRNNERQG